MERLSKLHVFDILDVAYCAMTPRQVAVALELAGFRQKSLVRAVRRHLRRLREEHVVELVRVCYGGRTYWRTSAALRAAQRRALHQLVDDLVPRVLATDNSRGQASGGMGRFGGVRLEQVA